MKPFRVVFMGTPDFAVPALKKLIDHHNVVAVYTQPPRPKGRGHQVQKSPIHTLAGTHNIPVETPKSLKDETAQEQLRAYAPDIIVVVAYGLLLPKAVLELPALGCLNIHGSLLPRWRGAAPLHRAILAGDTQTGITIMQMDEGLDTGPLWATTKHAIPPHATTAELHDLMAQSGAHLLLEVLRHRQENPDAHPTPQPQAGVTYAHKLTKDEGHIRWKEKTAPEIERQIRALTPWPGSWCLFKGTKLKIQSAELCKTTTTAKPGTVLTNDLVVACKQGTLRITCLQKPGGSPLTTADFVRGFPIPPESLLE